MVTGLSTRGRWLITALIFLLVGIISVLIIPFAVFQTLYNQSNYIVLTIPLLNFQYFIYSLLAILACILLLAFVRKWYTYMVLAIVTILGIAVSSSALTSYFAVEETSISYKYFQTEEQFLWTDIASITFEYMDGRQEADYILHLHDGSTFTFPHTGSIGSDGKRSIYREAVKHDISFTEQKK